MTISRQITTIRNSIIGGLYRRILKPIFFAQDPERVHDHFVRVGKNLGRYRWTRRVTDLAFGYRDPILRTTVAGITFANPVGLSAGFDKHGHLPSIIGQVGFGFMEVGSVTGTPGPGNPKPRLWRLPEYRSLAVHYGLNSDGAAMVARRLQQTHHTLPYGVSIAKANLPEMDNLELGIADYVRAAKEFASVAKYVTINISCPNTTGGEPFTEPEHCDRLLTVVMPLLSRCPVFIKLPAHLSVDHTTRLVDVGIRRGVRGYIVSNLSTNRSSLTSEALDRAPRGGLSGKLVEDGSNRLLLRLYRRFGTETIFIGVGGIFSAEDAYRKIRLGASLVQLITGMIYEGPQLISTITLGLAERLRADGFSSVNEAVGVDSHG